MSCDDDHQYLDPKYPECANFSDSHYHNHLDPEADINPAEVREWQSKQMIRLLSGQDLDVVLALLKSLSGVEASADGRTLTHRRTGRHWSFLEDCPF